MSHWEAGWVLFCNGTDPEPEDELEVVFELLDDLDDEVELFLTVEEEAAILKIS